MDSEHPGTEPCKRGMGSTIGTLVIERGRNVRGMKTNPGEPHGRILLPLRTRRRKRVRITTEKIVKASWEKKRRNAPTRKPNRGKKK